MVRCLLFVVCLLFDVRGLLFGVFLGVVVFGARGRCSLFVVWCSILIVVCCSLVVVCCVLFGVCCLMFAVR